MKTQEVLDRVRSAMEEVFNREWLVSIARLVGFVQRSTSRLQGDDLVKLLTTEILTFPTISLPGMCDLLREINPTADMTPQALCERINSEAAVNYLSEVLRFAVEKNLSVHREGLSASLFASFNRVFIEDSTVLTLNERLADKFKGSGGNASKAAVKIDFIFDLKRHTIHSLSMSGGNLPDQARAGEIVERLKEGDLVIRDLGYFATKALANIGAKKAFYLSRLLQGTGIYLSQESSAPAIDILDHLDKKFAHNGVMDLDIYLGQERTPCRLIVYRASEDVVNERIRKADAKARKKGRQLSEESKKWLRFSFFVTNVSRQVWSAEVIGTIYRIRWQIELTFKTWKSLCQIHFLKGQRSERIQCLIYGRLIAIVIMNMVYSFASWYSETRLNRETSLHKLVTWLERRQRLSKAALLCQFCQLLSDLIQDLPSIICKKKRKRKTTMELIESRVPYEEGFPIGNQYVPA